MCIRDSIKVVVFPVNRIKVNDHSAIFVKIVLFFVNPLPLVRQRLPILVIAPGAIRFFFPSVDVYKRQHHIFNGQSLQDKHFAPGQQSGINLKGRVFRGSSNQNNASLLHKGEKGVLLCFIKSVNLIYKYYSANARAAAFLRPGHDFFDLFNSCLLYTSGNALLHPEEPRSWGGIP